MKRLHSFVFVLIFAIMGVLAGCANSDTGHPKSFSSLAPAAFPTGLGAGFPTAQVHEQSSGPAEVGKPAPNFAFVWDDGRGADLAALQGRTVIINFWATWCGPCRAEMPELVALHNSTPDLLVLEINTQEELAVIRPFAQEFNMTMPVLVDKAGVLRSLYGVRSMPTTLVIDAEGLVRSRWAGLLTGEQLRQLVAQVQAN